MSRTPEFRPQGDRHRGRRPGGGTKAAFLGAVAVGAALSIALTAWVVTETVLAPEPQPSPVAAAPPTISLPPATVDPSDVGASEPENLSAKRKVPRSEHTGASLVVPALGVDAVSVPMRFVDGDLQEPESTAVVAHLDGEVPGITDALGTVLIGGHVSDNSDVDGIFRDLDSLKRGDMFRVTEDDGTTRQFRVTELVTYPKDGFPWDEVLDYTTPLRVALMTCSDRVTYPNGGFHYRSITIAYGTPADLA